MLRDLKQERRVQMEAAGAKGMLLRDLAEHRRGPGSSKHTHMQMFPVGGVG